MAGREKQGSSNEQAEAPGPNPFGIKDPTMARNGSLERPPASKEPLKALSALIFHIWGNQRHQQHSLEPIPSKFPCYEHMTSGITLPGEKVVPLWRTYPCPAEAAGTRGGGLVSRRPRWAGQRWKQPPRLLSASFWLSLHREAVCPLGKADEGVIQKSQDGLSAAQSEGQRVWKKSPCS